MAKNNNSYISLGQIEVRGVGKYNGDEKILIGE